MTSISCDTNGCSPNYFSQLSSLFFFHDCLGTIGVSSLISNFICCQVESMLTTIVPNTISEIFSLRRALLRNLFQGGGARALGASLVPDILYVFIFYLLYYMY